MSNSNKARRKRWQRPQAWAALVGVAFLIINALIMPLTNVGYGDSDELITVAHELGVAHPPGFPLLILLLRAAQSVPLPLSIAARSHLFTALLSSVVLSLVFLTTHQIHIQFGLKKKPFRGKRLLNIENEALLLAGLTTTTLGFSFLYLLYSHVTEKYMLGLVFLSCLIWLLVSCWSDQKRFQKSFWVAALLFGLGMSHLQTITLFTPAALYYIWLKKAWLTKKIGAKAGLALILGGLLPFLLLPLFQRSNNISWQFEESLPGIIHMATRRDFAGDLYSQGRSVGAYFTSLNLPQSGQALVNYIKVTLAYFGWWFALVIVLACLTPKAPAARQMHLFLLLSFLFLGPLLAAYLRWPEDLGSQAVLQRQYLLGYVPLALFSYFGWHQLWNRLSKAALVLVKPKTAIVVVVTVLAIPITLQAAYNMYEANLRDMTFVADVYEAALATAPENALVVCFSDPSCFSLLYLQNVQHQRPDVIIVPTAYPLVHSKVDLAALSPLSYPGNPTQVLDLISWSLTQGRPVYLVDLNQFYHTFLGLEYGVLHYQSLPYYGTLGLAPAASPTVEIPETLTQLRHSRLPQRDLMRRWLHINLANQHLLKALTFLKADKREEAQEQLNQAANMHYQHDELQKQQISAIRGSLEQIQPEAMFAAPEATLSAQAYLDFIPDLEKVKKYGRAHLAAKGAVTVAPGNIEARLKLAEIYAVLGDAVFARTEYENVLRLDPGNQKATEALQALPVAP